MIEVDLIVAVDPASSFGWAVFRVEAGEPVLLESGALKTKGPWGGRFDQAADHLTAVIARNKRITDTVWVAYEDIQARTLRSWDNYRVVTGLIASVYCAAHRCGIEDHYIAPIALASAKLHATGNGKADKPMMVEAFRRKYDQEPTTDDEADAAHVGSTLCEILQGRVKLPGSVAWKRLLPKFGVEVNKPKTVKRKPRKKKA